MGRRLLVLALAGSLLLIPPPARAVIPRGGGGHRRHVIVGVRRGTIVRSAIGRVTVPDGFDACARRVPLRVKAENGEEITGGHGRTHANGAYNLSFRGPWRIEVIAHAVRRDGDLCARATGQI